MANSVNSDDGSLQVLDLVCRAESAWQDLLSKTYVLPPFLDRRS